MRIVPPSMACSAFLCLHLVVSKYKITHLLTATQINYFFTIRDLNNENKIYNILVSFIWTNILS